MIIYTLQSSKNTRKQKINQESLWNKHLDHYGIRGNVKSKFVPIQQTQNHLSLREGADDFKKVESLKTSQLETFKKNKNIYTGNQMIGIATMHKSNMVPVFSTESAVDISKMRRG